MRARRVGTGPEFRLFQDEKEIGRVDDTTVNFLGFATRDDAALAASAAYRALAQRWPDPERPQESSSATRVPADPEEAATGVWSFEIPLLPSERMEVFALARARVIWRALQGTGIARRMRQFADRLRTLPRRDGPLLAVPAALAAWSGSPLVDANRRVSLR